MEIKRRDISNDNKEVIVSVKESGNGINQSIFPRLFSKFATNSPKGTGYCLYQKASLKRMAVGSGLRIIVMSIECWVGLHFTLAYLLPHRGTYRNRRHFQKPT